MDRHNWYAGRTVLDTDLNDTLSWILTAHENMALDYGMHQYDAASNPDRRGAILKGLVVTQHGLATALQVDVTIGTCKDDTGQRAELTSAATITLTHTGLLAKGATSGAATITPVAIGPAVGQEVWVSLYLKYAELTSNPKTDLTGGPVDFDITESWQFEIRAGTPGAPPVTSRDALANGRMLLVDLLIENPAGTLQIKTNSICGSNDDLDILGYGLNDPAALSGRRSDWIAAENPTEFPSWRFAGAVEQRFALRAGNPREAIYDLCKALARQTAVAGPPRQPAGGELIGRAADTGAAGTNRTMGAKSLAAGNLDSQLGLLLDILSDALMAGGGNIITPQTATDGIVLDPVSLDADRHLLKTMSISGGGAGNVHRSYGNRYGHRTSPHEFLDDFMVIGAASNAYPTQPGADDSRLAWHAVTNDDGNLVLLNEPGGVVRINSGLGSPAVNEYVYIATGLNATAAMRWWNCGATPWAIMTVRFRLPTSVADRRIRIGFWSDDPLTHAASAVYMEFDTAVDPTKLYVRGMTGGVPGTAVEVFDPIAPDVWYTFRLAMVDNQHVVGQLNSGGNWYSADAGGAVANAGYTLGIYNETLAVATSKALDIDQISASDGLAIPDMLS